jgi:hypothetical protein
MARDKFSARATRNSPCGRGKFKITIPTIAEIMCGTSGVGLAHTGGARNIRFPWLFCIPLLHMHEEQIQRNQVIINKYQKIPQEFMIHLSMIQYRKRFLARSY